MASKISRSLHLFVEVTSENAGTDVGSAVVAAALDDWKGISEEDRVCVKMDTETSGKGDRSRAWTAASLVQAYDKVRARGRSVSRGGGGSYTQRGAARRS
jgi:hypothetical protein